MQIVKEPVKSESKVVGIAEIEQFGSLEEAITFFTSKNNGDTALGTADVLGLVNTQHGTNVRNRIRSAFAKEPSKTALMEQARKDFISQPADQIVQFAGDPAKMEGWLEDRIKTLQSEWKSRRDQQAAEFAAANPEAATEGA